MKIHYDKAADALYLKFSDVTPDGVVEVSEGVNVDTTDDGKLAGIEILGVSGKFDIETIMSYTLDLDQPITQRKIA